MATNFYWQKTGFPSASDIEQSLGIRITSVRGLHPADPKELFTRDWAGEDGVDVYIPTTRKKKAQEVIMTCFAESDTYTTAIEKYDNFCAAIFNGEFTYWDTLQNKQVVLIYMASKPVWYQFVDKQKIMFEATFLNASGGRTDI